MCVVQSRAEENSAVLLCVNVSNRMESGRSVCAKYIYTRLFTPYTHTCVHKYVVYCYKDKIRNLDQPPCPAGLGWAGLAGLASSQTCARLTPVSKVRNLPFYSEKKKRKKGKTGNA